VGTVLIGNGSWFGGALTAPTITFPTGLSAGTVGTAYSVQFTASGATPITWSVVSGTLPTGLTFSSSGLLSGTPTATVVASPITFRATNIYGSANVALSLTINSANTAPVVTITTLDSAVVNTSYNFTLTATGTTPITWVLQSGILPAGLTLSSSGFITGIPTVVATTSGLVFRATNIAGYGDSASLSLTVSATGGPTAITAPSIVVWRAA